MFVIVSWISFLVPPESVPGRMTILVTVFLVLVNIFNSITSNIPKVFIRYICVDLYSLLPRLMDSLQLRCS